MIKKFEEFGDLENVRGWKDDLFLMHDAFVELIDEIPVEQVEYQAGYRTSDGQNSYCCYLSKSEEIEGRSDSIDFMINVSSRILLRTRIIVKYENRNYSPFHAGYFGENADLLIKIMSKIRSVKNKLDKKYSINIRLDDLYFIVEFLEKPTDPHD